MFGYLRPVREELKVREYELYKSVYCGLCRRLGRDYGIITRFTLSYDCTVLAMLAASLREENSCVKRGRCRFNPMKKCMFCATDGEAMHLAGGVSVIMAYYKLYDTITDSGFFKRLAARLLRVLLRGGFRRARKAYPDIEAAAGKMIESQQLAERKGSGIDESADPTAKMLSFLCERLSDDEMTRRVLSRFGYCLGRWIYLIDAADDLEKDIKHRCFNPFISVTEADSAETAVFCNETLNMTASQLIMAYELLQPVSYREILDNIVYHGLSFQQKHCIFEKKRKKGRKMKDRKKKDYYTFLSRGDEDI